MAKFNVGDVVQRVREFGTLEGDRRGFVGKIVQISNDNEAIKFNSTGWWFSSFCYELHNKQEEPTDDKAEPKKLSLVKCNLGKLWLAYGGELLPAQTQLYINSNAGDNDVGTICVEFLTDALDLESYNGDTKK